MQAHREWYGMALDDFDARSVITSFFAHTSFTNIPTQSSIKNQLRSLCAGACQNPHAAVGGFTVGSNRLFQ